MQLIQSIFWLSRPVNQFFIVLTMFIVRYTMVFSAYGFEINFRLDFFWFVMLVLSVVCISSAGYIINDYFDVQTDEINKPDKIYIGRTIKRRKAMVVHQVINIIGLLLGLACALKVGNPFLFIYHALAATALWVYSAHLKRKLLIGNIVVSLLIGLVVWLGIAYEIGGVNDSQNWASASNLLSYGFIYATFAFLMNLMREIIKDAEDFEGDQLISSNTIPIKYGIKTTRRIVIALAVFTGFLMFGFSQIVLQILSVNSPILYWLLNFMTLIPFIHLILKLKSADTKIEFSFISKLLKIIMLFGILSMIVMLWM